MIECVEQDSVEVAYLQFKGLDAEISAEECVNAIEATDAEETVPIASVRSLEEFELQSEADRTKAFQNDVYSAASKSKEGANMLFKLKDFDAAAEHYSFAINALREFKGGSTGDLILVNQAGALVLGSIADVDTDSLKANVRLKRQSDAEFQLLVGVPWRTLVPVHEEQLQLHSSLYMNRSRCFSQTGRYQHAAQDLSIVLGLWSTPPRRGTSHGEKSAEERKEQLTKAYYLRAKTRLARMKFTLARADVAEAWKLEPPDATAKLLRQFEREVDIAQKELERSNKKLAKEISRFAESAMAHLAPEQLVALEENAQQ